MRRMDAGGYAACFDHQQLALLCANSDRTIDRLGVENNKLKAENAKLRELMYERAHKHAIHHMTEDELRITAANVMAENAKLRELVDGLRYCANESHGHGRCSVRFVDGYVTYCPLYDVDSDTARCEALLRELGVEVDE